MTVTPQHVTCERQGHVAILTLNRPSRRNAITDEMRGDLRRWFAALTDDREVRAVVLTGAGSVFCAGGDTKQMGERNAAGADYAARHAHYVNETAATAMAVASFGKPLIAAVNGAAIGAGLGLVLLADLRVASDTAVFGAPFVQLGLAPDWGAAYTLTRIVGEEQAARMLLAGERLDSEQALQRGLVSERCPADAVLSRAVRLAEQVAAGAPLALGATKAALREDMLAGLARALRTEAIQQPRLTMTEDHREAIAALADTRAPRFVGE